MSVLQWVDRQHAYAATGVTSARCHLCYLTPVREAGMRRASFRGSSVQLSGVGAPPPRRVQVQPAFAALQNLAAD